MPADRFVVRLYDGFDNTWIDVTATVPRAEADRVFAEKTGNGTHHVRFADIDYYRIFPADTQMLYSTAAGWDPDTRTWRGAEG
jgi:hypothetical protein